jgi:hypothetical protein
MKYTKEQFLKAAELGEVSMIDAKHICSLLDEIAPQLPQQEISDEEIKKGGENAWSDYEYQEGNLYSTTFRDGWLMACKWYREQLKQRQ